MSSGIIERGWLPLFHDNLTAKKVENDVKSDE